MRRWLAPLLLLCMLLPRQAGAQDSSRVDELRPGVRVRFHAPAVAPDRFVGTIRWLTADSIALDAPDHHLATVPRAPITTMEISLGASRTRGARRGLMWGVPIGAALGALLTAQLRTSDAPFPVNTCCQQETTRKTVMIAFTAFGALFGGGFGAANPSERWRPVALTADPRAPSH